MCRYTVVSGYDEAANPTYEIHIITPSNTFLCTR